MRTPPFFPAPTTFPTIPDVPVGGPAICLPKICALSEAPPTIFASVLPSATKDTLLMLRFRPELLTRESSKLKACARGVPMQYTQQQFVDLLKRRLIQTSQLKAV